MELKWQPIIGFEDYTVSEDGQVKNKKGIAMKTRVDRAGYERVNLQKGKQKHTVKVHWAVLSTFNPNQNSRQLTIDHIDGDIKNNKVTNLRWCSMGENLRLQHFRNNEEILFFIDELKKIYSEDSLSEILKTLLSLARQLKNT